MRVLIAGYNVDSSLLERLNKDVATPEVLSAAYARISRSVKSAPELRTEALGEIGKARGSNQKIIFEMGHASVAEHAVFNIDLIGISRCITELVQRSRLASFTEKSQRYVTFNRDYVIPAALLANPSLRDEYIQLCELLFEEYSQCLQALTLRLAAKHPDLGKRDLETMAKEDARYILPLATKTQMGMTINARSLEVLLRRLSASPLSEAKELWEQLYVRVSAIAPSLMRYTKADTADFLLDETVLPVSWAEELPAARLDSITPNGDDLIMSILLFEQGHGDPKACQKKLAGMADLEKDLLWQKLFADLKPWQKLPRAFEAVDLEYELQLSECSWGQLKRHRSATLIKGACSLDDSPLIIPPSVLECARKERWEELTARLRAFRARLDGPLKQYLRINAEAVKVYARLSLRELYHFSRLRSDQHAQWEIRNLSNAMTALARPLAPRASTYLGGKSEFDQLGV